MELCSQWHSVIVFRIVGCHDGNSIIEKSNLFKYVDFQKFSMAHLGLHIVLTGTLFTGWL